MSILYHVCRVLGGKNYTDEITKNGPNTDCLTPVSSGVFIYVFAYSRNCLEKSDGSMGAYLEVPIWGKK